MAIISKEKFSQEKMDKLLEYLKMYQELMQPIDFEIVVDGFKAVRRTDNTELFPYYENFINANTKGIEVLFYQGTSNNNDKHIFTFAEEPKDTGLSGIEIDNRIQEGIEKEKKTWEFEQLRQKNKELEGEVEELEEEVDKLEKQLSEAKLRESPLKGFLGEMGSTMVESFIRRNPQMLANIPGGQALAGFIEEDNKRLEEGGDRKEPELQVSFRAKEEEPVSSEAKEAANFVKYLKGKFNQQQFGKLMQIIDLLAEAPEKIDSVFNGLKAKEDGNVQV